LLATARLFAVSIARGVGCREDDVGDLRLGVSDACTRVILGSSETDVVNLLITSNTERLVVQVDGAAERSLPGPDAVELLPALFADFSIGSDGVGRRRLSFSVPVPTA
jgi:hypothetical protein